MNTKTSSFFIVTPLGFEDLALLELQEKWELFYPDIPLESYTVQKGGIELECPLSRGLHLNLFLKIPSKILLRLDQFKCRDFPKLFKKISKFKWNDYLMGQIPKVSATSHHSRLLHSGRVEEVVIEGIKKYYQGNPPKEKHIALLPNIPETVLNVLVDNDLLTLSINTSGDLLYKRGIKTLVGEAPLRENLAAGLLAFLRQNHPVNYETLIDPMCGSGTFLTEDLTYYDLNDKRIFSFQYFPILEKMILTPVLHPSKIYFGFDNDQEMINKVKESLTDLKIDFVHNDIFSNEKPKSTFLNSIVIVNPPYGKRIKIESPKEYYRELIKNIFMKYSPSVLGILIPSEYSFKPDKNFKLINSLTFSNGGTDVVCYLIKKEIL